MKILDIALKDLTRSMRSVFLLGMAVGAPMVLTLLIYFAFGDLARGSSDLPSISVGVVNLDQISQEAAMPTSIGQSIRDMFFADSVQSWISASEFATEAEARLAVDKRKIGMVVIVPEGLTEDLLAGKSLPSIVIVHDPTLSIGPLIVRNMVQSLMDGVAGGGIAWKTVTERQQVNGLPPDPVLTAGLLKDYETWYVEFQQNLFHEPTRAALALQNLQAETVDPVQTMVSMIMMAQIIFFAFFTGSYAMMSILQEDEEGTLARLFSTPTNHTNILAGKFLAVFLTVLLQGVVLIILASLVFQARWGMTGSAILALVGQVLASGGLGVLLVSLIKHSRQAGPIFGGGLTFMGMLSGLFTASLPNPPEIFNKIGNFTPMGWVLRAWKLSLAGSPPMELLLPFAVLCGMSGVMFTIGALIFRRRYA